MHCAVANNVSEMSALLIESIPTDGLMNPVNIQYSIVIDSISMLEKILVWEVYRGESVLQKTSSRPCSQSKVIRIIPQVPSHKGYCEVCREWR